MRKLLGAVVSRLLDRCVAPTGETFPWIIHVPSGTASFDKSAVSSNSIPK